MYTILYSINNILVKKRTLVVLHHGHSFNLVHLVLELLVAVKIIFAE